jgi:hypothetical protein
MELLDAFADFKYPNEIGPGSMTFTRHAFLLVQKLLEKKSSCCDSSRSIVGKSGCLIVINWAKPKHYIKPNSVFALGSNSSGLLKKRILVANLFFFYIGS